MTHKKSVHLFYFQCPITDICQNNQCFWKQRDCYGLSPFYYVDEDGGSVSRNADITVQYGEPYFPKTEGKTGTNVISVWCDDAIIDDSWEEGVYSSEEDQNRINKLRKTIFMHGIPKC